MALNIVDNYRKYHPVSSKMISHVNNIQFLKPANTIEFVYNKLNTQNLHIQWNLNNQKFIYLRVAQPSSAQNSCEAPSLRIPILSPKLQLKPSPTSWCADANLFVSVVTTVVIGRQLLQRCRRQRTVDKPTMRTAHYLYEPCLRFPSMVSTLRLYACALRIVIQTNKSTSTFLHKK